MKQGAQPTKNAIDGLEWTLQFSPFDGSLCWLVVQQMAANRRFSEAGQALAPLAYSLHPGEHTDKARELLKEVEARVAPADALDSTCA